MGRKGLILASLPFAAVGAWMAIGLARSIHAYLKMQKWVKVPAQIRKADLLVGEGEDGPTYSATAEYEYVYGQSTYRGTRIGLEGYGRKTYGELKQHQQDRSPYRCFVDPDHPQESILKRDLRWDAVFFEMIFMVSFGGFGLGLLAAAILGYSSLPGTGSSAETAGETPWLARADWAAGKMLYSEKIKAVVLTVFATIWNLAAMPVWMAVGGGLPWPGGALDWAVRFVAVLGLLWIACAAAVLRRWLLYGDSLFQMTTVPGVIGGQLAGVIQIGIHARPDDNFRLALSCIRQIRTGGEESPSTTEEIQWQSVHEAAAEMAEGSADRSAVPVLFGIPHDCRPTETIASKDKRSKNIKDSSVWRLEIAGPTGGRYLARFEVPVFKRPASDPGRVGDDCAATAIAAGGDPQHDLRAVGVLCAVAPDGDGRRFSFPPARKRGATADFAPFCVVWAMLIWLLWQCGASMILGGIFVLIGVRLSRRRFDLWLYQSTLDVSLSRLAVRGGWLGIGRRREVSIGDVLAIEAVPGRRSNEQIVYDLVLVSRGGEKIRFAKRLHGNWTAQSVIRAIEEAMGRTK